MAIELILNGRPTSLAASPAERLLDVLRRQGHCLGVKEGCGEGECGACTIIVDADAVCACLLLAGQVQGARVETIEGIATAAEPHPLLDAMQQTLGTQCGFCTPGIVTSAKALLDRHPTPTRDQIKTALAGNLCRCTGYHKIFEAVEQAARATTAEPAAEAGRRDNVKGRGARKSQRSAS